MRCQTFKFSTAIAFMLAVCAEGAFAQVSFDKGIKAGLNISRFDSRDSESRVGLILGGFLTVEFTELFALQPELYYAMKGGRYVEEFLVPAPLGQTATVHAKWDLLLPYFEIPVLAKVSIGEYEGFHPALFLGPFFAVNAGGLATLDLEGSEAKLGISPLSDIDYGLTGGAAVSYLISGRKISLDVRYNLGLHVAFTTYTNVNGMEKVREVKTRTLSILVACSL